MTQASLQVVTFIKIDEDYYLFFICQNTCKAQNKSIKALIKTFKNPFTTHYRDRQIYAGLRHRWTTKNPYKGFIGSK